MRGSERSVAFCYLLRGIVEVDPGKVVLLHPRHHVLKRVIWVGRRAIRINPYKLHPMRLKFFAGLSRHFVRADNVGAVVAGKEDDERACVGKAVEGVYMPICTCQAKFWGFGFQWKSKCHDNNPFTKEYMLAID